MAAELGRTGPTSFQMKLSTPEPYDGTGDYEEWSEKLIGYISLENYKYATVMLDYGISPMAPSTDELVGRYDDDLTEDYEKVMTLSRRFYR